VGAYDEYKIHSKATKGLGSDPAAGSRRMASIAVTWIRSSKETSR